jgi:hypothetical protein
MAEANLRLESHWKRRARTKAIGNNDYLNSRLPPVRGSGISNRRWASVG